MLIISDISVAYQVELTVSTEEKFFFANARGDTLCGVLHHPADRSARSAVILCHGMESSKDSDKLLYLAQLLAQNGIAALRFDFAYVGESSGKFEDITYSGEVEDLKAAHALMLSRGAEKIAILGSSMGGTVALLFAAREPKVAALVTVAAPVHPERFPDRVLTPEQSQNWRERGFTFYNGQRINLALLHDLEKINVAESVKKITCPVLILHGDADEVVPVEEAYELAGCLSHTKRLSILKGADHRLSNPEMMRQAIREALEWLAFHVQ